MAKGPFLPAVALWLLLLWILAIAVESRSAAPFHQTLNRPRNNLRRHLGGRDEDRVTFYVFHPDCIVTCVGTNWRTGRTLFRVDCPEDDDEWAEQGDDEIEADDDQAGSEEDDDSPSGGGGWWPAPRPELPANPPIDAPRPVPTPPPTEVNDDGDISMGADDDIAGGDDDDDIVGGDDDDDIAADDDDDDDDGPIVAAAETDSIAREDQATEGVSPVASALFAVAGLMLLIAICGLLYIRSIRQTSKLDDEDAQKLLGEAFIDEAYAMPRPYRDEELSYRPPPTWLGGAAAMDDLEDEGLWEEYVQALMDYKAQHGDCLVPSNYVDKEGRQLGQWVTLQRHLAGSHDLDRHKYHQLSVHGFVWKLQQGDGTAEEHGIVTDPIVWDEYMQSLRAYKESHGDCQVPYSYVDSEGRALGKWAHRQRNRANRGSLSEAQTAELAALGFSWMIPKLRFSSTFGSSGLIDLEDDRIWEEYVQCLANYKSQHGDCLVPPHYRDPEDRPLGQWVTLQRHLYHAGELSHEKKDRLLALGFDCNLQDGDGAPEEHGIVSDPRVWLEYLESLKEYKKSYGDCNVPFSYKDNKGRALGKWVHRQRHRAKRSSLPKARKSMLDSLGFDWEIPRGRFSFGSAGLIDLEDYNQFEEYALCLEKYKSEHGDCLVPNYYRDPEGRPLGQWVTLQRHLAAANELPQDKVALLTALGFAWELQDGDGTAEDHGIVTDSAMWNKYLGSLKIYKEKHGNCEVPFSYLDSKGRPLGKWVHRQRHRAKRGTLPIDHWQTKALDRLGFEWDIPTNIDLKNGFGDSTVESSLTSPTLLKRRSSLLQRILSSKTKGNDTRPRTPARAFGEDDQLEAFEDLEDESLWEEYVQCLVDYKAERGDCLVPSTYKNPDGRPLGQWVTLQRHLAAANELSQDKMSQLTRLDFVWELQYGDGSAEDNGIVRDPEEWDQYLQSLNSYKKEHGNCEVPIHYIDSEGRALGKWAHGQKHRAKRGTLSNDQRKKLAAIGFSWKIPGGRCSFGSAGSIDLEDDGIWNDYYLSVVDYKSQHGDCLVPFAYRDQEGRPLGQWVTLQRHLAAANELSKDKMSQLTALGFTWELQDADDTAEEHGIVSDPGLWAQYLESLKAYKKKHGDSQVPFSYVDEEGRALGKWVHRQRHKAKRGTLLNDQRKQLEKLGLDWEIPGSRYSFGAAGQIDLEDDRLWNEYMQSLANYKSQEGNCLVPSFYRDPEGRPLGQWVTLQRHLYAAGELPHDKIHKLSALDFEWKLQDGDGSAEALGIVSDPRVRSQYHDSLKAYKKKHGDCEVPFSYLDEEGRSLGKWVHRQRHKAKRGTLSNGQRQQLEQLGLDWEIPIVGTYTFGTAGSIDLEYVGLWKEYVQALDDYKAQHGDCLVPAKYRDKKGRPLGQWVTLQRHLAEAGELSQDKIAELTAHGFVWELQDGDDTAADHGIISDPLVWNQYLESLKAYKKKYGDCKVPFSYLDDEGRPVGKWVHRQRHRAKRGTLSKDEKRQLENIGGFDWKIPDNHAGLDNQSIHPKSTTSSKRRKSSILQRLFSSKRKSIQVGAGEEFDDDEWDEYLHALMDFQALHGDCNVPLLYKDESSGLRLGKWVSYQRVRNAGNQLSIERFNELDSVGFIWDLQVDDDKYRPGATLSDVTEDWDSYVEALAKYRNVHGDCLVPDGYKDKKGRGLGAWVSNVRDVAAQNELPPHKRAELNELSFDWETHRGDGYGLPGGCGYGRWEEYFDAVVEYKLGHGDCRVPSTYIDKNGLELGAWVANQCHRADQDELPYKSHDRLTTIGFDFDFDSAEEWSSTAGTDPEIVWDRHVQSIVDYKANYGNADSIPRTFEDWNGVGLGAWCINQSEKAAKGQLHPTLQKELKSIGVDLDRFRYGHVERYDAAYVFNEFEDEEEDSLGGPRRPSHMNVHRCTSALCEVCKANELVDSVTFQPTAYSFPPLHMT